MRSPGPVPPPTWDAPLNQTSNYANEARDVAAKGEHWLKSHRKVANRAIVLDVDDTTLTTGTTSSTATGT